MKYINLKKIEQLIQIIDKSNILEIEIKKDGNYIHLISKQHNIYKKNILKTNKIINHDKKNIVENKIIKSPMIGTFYNSSSPNDIPFVNIGKKINKGDVVCIIESMKVFNQIQSKYDGIIKKIFLKNNEPVEFGENLFLIE